MDAIALLKADHKKVKGLFREFEAAGDRAFQTKRRIANEAMMELEIHTKIEEQVFYPAVAAKGTQEEKDLVLEGLEEHHEIKLLIGELRALSPEAENFDAKFKVISENVEHHIKEEEDEMLPDARKKLGDAEIDRLGDQMAELKAQLTQAAPAR